MLAGGGRVEAHRQGHADRGRPEVADLPHEARALELLGADAGLAQAAQGLGVGLAGADGRVVAGRPLGQALEAGQGLRGAGAVGVEEHLEPVAGLGLGAQAPDVVDLAPGARQRAEAGHAARGADQEGHRRAGREGVADPLLVGDQVVRGHHQRRRGAPDRQGRGDLEGVEQRARVAADVQRGHVVEAEGAGQGGRQLAQPEGRRLADGDHRPGGLGALERGARGLVGHREGVLVEGRGAQGLGTRAPGAAVELLDLPEGGPVAGQVGPVPEDLPHAASA